MKKISKPFVARLKKRVKAYGGSVVLLAVASVLSHGVPTSATSVLKDLGGFVLLVLGVAVVLLPAILVQLFDIKVRHPKPTYVEPGFVWLLLLACSCVATAFLGIALGVEQKWPDALIFFVAMAGFALPVDLYMLNARLRYKRIIQYGSAEWRRFHRK